MNLARDILAFFFASVKIRFGDRGGVRLITLMDPSITSDTIETSGYYCLDLSSSSFLLFHHHYLDFSFDFIVFSNVGHWSERLHHCWRYPGGRRGPEDPAVQSRHPRDDRGGWRHRRPHSDARRVPAYHAAVHLVQDSPVTMVAPVNCYCYRGSTPYECKIGTTSFLDVYSSVLPRVEIRLSGVARKTVHVLTRDTGSEGYEGRGTHMHPTKRNNRTASWITEINNSFPYCRRCCLHHNNKVWFRKKPNMLASAGCNSR